MSKADVWMPLYIGDWLRHTLPLSLEDEAAYLRLVTAYWQRGSALPDDDVTLARLVRVNLRKWRTLRNRMAAFFEVSAGFWRHKRIDTELNSARENAARKQAKASLAANVRWGNRAPAPMPGAMLGASPDLCLEQCPSPSPSSVPTEQAHRAPSDPNKEGWSRAVALLVGSGRMRETTARRFFGKLLAEHKLDARDLLPSVVGAEGKATPDPQGYLTAAAKAVAGRRGQGVKVAGWAAWSDDEWSVALARFRRDGAWLDGVPEPGEAGCPAPEHLLRPAA